MKLTDIHPHAGKIFLLAGILLTIYGIWRGEPSLVAHKSNLICLECIGIG